MATKKDLGPVDALSITEEFGRLHLLAKLLDNLQADVTLNAGELEIIGGLLDECANTLEGVVPVHLPQVELHIVGKAE